MVHFTVACLVAKPLNRNETKVDLVMIQMLLLFKCELLCYHSNWILHGLYHNMVTFNISVSKSKAWQLNTQL